MDEKVKKQLIALIQAAQNGNEKAIAAIQQIKQLADQGDQQAAALMEAMNAIAQQMQPQQPQKVMARLGAKLNYIRTIKGDCPEGQQLVYFKQGGRVCKKCVEAAGGAKVKDGKKEISDFKKKKACGGSKMKFQPGGKTPKKEEWTKEDDKKLLKYRLKGTKNSAEKKDSTDIQTKWNKLPEKVKAKYEVKEKCGGKVKKHFFGGVLGF